MLGSKKTKETKEEKQARKERELLQKYGLDELNDPKDIESIKKVVSELAGSGIAELGMALTFTKVEDSLPVYYQRAIVEQNFIIIRQLDRIAKALAKQ